MEMEEMDFDQKLTFHEFSKFCEVLSSLEGIGRDKKRDKRRSDFIKSCREMMPASDTNQSLFPLMRLFLPYLDKGRVYKIKEAVMGKLFINMLQIGERSEEAKKLLNFKNPKNNFGGQNSDFASVLHTVIANRCYTSKRITVAEINLKLDRIIATNEAEGKKAVEMILRDLYQKMDALELKWLVRVILKRMPLGVGEVFLFKALHDDAKALYEVNANLEAVCEKLRDPKIKLHQLEVSLMTPFRPQLSDRKKVKELSGLMKKFYIETKYDGERCQLHKRGDTFRYFSRNGQDFTKEYGETSDDSRMFSSVISACLASSVQDIILDGEMCTWSKELNCLLQKGKQFNIRQMRNDDQVHQCLILYDILLLNGRVLSGLPLKERVAILEGSVTPLEGRVEMSRRVLGSTVQEVQVELAEAIDRREEGLVLKDIESHYKPDARANGGWIKVKPDYEGALVDTLDLVILGGWYGSGRRAGSISNFLMGVSDVSDVSDDDGKKTFLSICKVGTGFNTWELRDAVSKCKRGSRQSHIRLGSSKPDVLFSPEQSPVIQIRATEIVDSEHFAAECSLRHPRVERLREDKDSSCCTSLAEVRNIQQMKGGKLFSKGQVEVGEDGKTRKRNSRRAQLGQIFRQQDLSQVDKVSQCLKDKVVVVEPGKVTSLKKEVERLVVKHGGLVEQNVSKTGRTDLYVETGMTVKGQNAVRAGKVDVVRSSWLTDQAGLENIEEPRPHQYIAMTDNTARSWREKTDQYLDPFTIPATRDSLQFSMEKVHELNDDLILDERQKADFECENDLTDMKTNLFRGLVFHFPPSGPPGLTTSLQLLELRVKLQGGAVSSVLDSKVTHVLTDQPSQHIRQVRRDRINRGETLFHLASTSWLQDCLTSQTLLGVGKYLL